MKWKINRSIRAPIVGLPHPQRHYPSILQLKPFLTLDNPDRTDAILGPLIGDQRFEVHCETSWEQLPPAPWQTFLGEPNSTDIKQAYCLEMAIVLRVLDIRELRKKQPLSVGKIYHQLIQTDFPRTLQEAFTFALFDLKLCFDKQPELQAWEKAVRGVIYERGELSRIEYSQSPLLRHGYQLLALISQQRQSRPSVDELNTAWDAFNEQVTLEKLPLVFPLIYWSEAALRLLEMGDLNAAEPFLAKQHEVASELLSLLPYLSDDVAGSLWLHHLGRLAYYRGEFRQALQHYSLEWQLRQQQPALKFKIQRSLASVLSDMGHWQCARALTQQALDKQRRDHALMYKNLGRLGEIQARQGEYKQALDNFSACWPMQSPEKRDGQTAVYMGHTYLLQGNLEEARNWYTQAGKADKKQNVFFNPYLLMGKIALALREGETEEVLSLWQAHKDKLAALRGDRVLPATVIGTGVYLADVSQVDWLDKQVEKLIETHYFIHALYPLALRYTTPSLAEKTLQDIIESLKQWQDAIEALETVSPQIPAFNIPEVTPTPAGLLKVLRTAREEDSWQVLESLLPQIYPMNLVQHKNSHSVVNN
jgi:tetratricopeptide (TPR) repeat protein